MIVVRFRVQCRPEKVEEARAAFREVIAVSRQLSGCVSFDMGEDLSDPSSFMAIEVFDDREALDRQEALPEVQRVVGLLDDLITGPPEATIFHVSSSEPWG